MGLSKTISTFLQKSYHKLFIDEDIFIHKIDDRAPWALVCYIPYVFYHSDETNFMDEHQSRREAIIIDEVLTSLGYNVYNLSYLSPQKLPHIDFKIILGLEPAFCDACRKYPKAKKIYYATGAFVEHQNGMVKQLTDTFNTKYHSNIPYRRTAPENNAAYLADEILQIGSSYTIDTYPEELKKKIHLIHQSSQATRLLDYIDYAPENEYFFMSSSGNILKGVPQLIECFSNHPELTLHIVGPIEDDIKDAMSDIITPNIIFHGFMNVNSDDYLNIVKHCNFNIYPSASEGGIPGAVINCMKNGLIPICSKWASFDGISEYGYMLNDITPESIENGIKWSLGLDREIIVHLKKGNAKKANTEYCIQNFRREFRNQLAHLL